MRDVGREAWSLSTEQGFKESYIIENFGLTAAFKVITTAGFMLLSCCFLAYFGGMARNKCTKSLSLRL